ncbi:MAG TPA: cupin domain-containing protein [Gemmatimonadaceae bacterium]|nr:cupin domain-containing protein [Gemmatimonadaceae bacterium]
MSSLDRTLEGDVLVHHLPRDEQTIDATLLAKHGRTARTLVKEGALRLTLMAVAPGGDVPAHHADGPVSVHVIEGETVFTAAGREHALAAGDVIVFGAGVEHAARSTNGCVMLLTVVHPAV